jgi:hypothetical protein
MAPTLIADVIQQPWCFLNVVPALILLAVDDPHGVSIVSILTGFTHMIDFIPKVFL